MFEALKSAYAHGVEVGKKHGFREGIKVYQDEAGMSNALGIVVTLAVVLVGLYIITIVVGSISYQVTNGNILMSSTFNSTIAGLNTQATSSFNIAGILPIAIVGTGIIAVVIGAFSYRG